MRGYLRSGQAQLCQALTLSCEKRRGGAQAVGERVQERPQSWEGGGGRRGAIGSNRTRSGARGLGLPESGWLSTGVAKASGAAGRPPGRTARLRPGSQDSEGLEAAVSLSAPWFPHLSRGSPFLKVRGPLTRAGAGPGPGSP